MNPALYKRHRFPAEIISHCVWLYFRFSLSLRDVEELMLERDFLVSYETIRRWCLKFGSEYARRLKHRRPQRQALIPVAGLIKAANTLDILVTKKRDKQAAKRFFHKLLKHYSKPRKIITDKLRSYGAALKDLLPWTPHLQSRYLNNRAENSHQRTRRRERGMQRRINYLPRPWLHDRRLSDSSLNRPRSCRQSD